MVLSKALLALRQLLVGFLEVNKVMLSLIRKVLFHLVAIALRAWQAEIFNRLERDSKSGKEVNNEETSSSAEKGE